ncbi:unnamed protein product [Caenorhabditis angaria]|uniref:Uncharacterized protein n=1 Tax=Caenorhabditis angaria TaxID=860376 RepID=A0A9P1MV51_9PELO|nr:unnamed protein product [Caenorhabditis angaria]
MWISSILPLLFVFFFLFASISAQKLNCKSDADCPKDQNCSPKDSFRPIWNLTKIGISDAFLCGKLIDLIKKWKKIWMYFGTR